MKWLKPSMLCDLLFGTTLEQQEQASQSGMFHSVPGRTGSPNSLRNELWLEVAARI